MTADIAVMATATATVIAAVALVVVPMRRVHTPTSGPRIDRATRPGMALLIVDLQTDFVEGNGYDEHEVETTIGRVNARAEEARAAGMPVATLRQIHRGPVATSVIRLVAKGRGNPGSPGLGLHDSLTVDADADFVKSRLDGFSNPALGQWLADHRVGTLEIVGLDGCYCVRATAIGAIDRGYDVRLDDDLILAVDRSRWQGIREDLSADGAQVIVR